MPKSWPKLQYSEESDKDEFEDQYFSIILDLLRTRMPLRTRMTLRLKVYKSVQPEVGRTNMMQTGGQELEDEDDTVSEDKSVQKRAARGLPGVQWPELKSIDG